MRRRISKPTILCAICSLFVVCIAVYRVWADLPSLLGRATKVVEFAPNEGFATYFWLSDHELLLLRDCRNEVPGDRMEALRFDERTQTFSHLTGLERALGTLTGNTHVDWWKLSPDGRWLLGDGSKHVPIPNGYRYSEVWFVCALDGSKIYTWPCSDRRSTDLVWMPDSRHWLRLQSGDSGTKSTIHTYGLDTSAVVSREYGFPTDDYQHLGYISPDIALGIATQFGSDHVLSARYQVGEYAGVELRSIPVPQDMRLNMEMALSPDGDRIAWRAGFPYAQFGLRLPRQLDPFHYRAPGQQGLWVSDLEGKHFRMLGAEPVMPNAISILRWVPDRRRLSFVCRDGIYTVPVEPSSAGSANPAGTM